MVKYSIRCGWEEYWEKRLNEDTKKRPLSISSKSERNGDSLICVLFEEK